MKSCKKILSFVIICILTIQLSCLPSYASSDDFSLIMCINDETAYTGSKKISISAPVLVHGKTYVDVFQIAELLDIDAKKNQDDILLEFNNEELRLKEINYWEDLLSLENVFFESENISYLPLRILTDLAKLKISYNDGVIFVGENKDNSDFSGYYINKDTTELNSIVYEKYSHCLTIAPNSDIAIVDGEEKKISKPLIIFDKIYINIYDIAPALNINVNLYENQIFGADYFGKTIYLSPINRWDDISSAYKYLVINDIAYVQLREFAQALGYNVFFDNWVINISLENEYVNKNYPYFGNISTDDANNYVYEAYPYEKVHRVYPYTEYSYENMLNDAANLKKSYPDLISLDSIGKSVEGRELLLLKLGKGATKIFVCGTHHAREYIATTYLMYAIDRYAYCYATTGTWNGYNVRQILDNVTFYIVPMVNPDGVNLVQNGVEATKNPEYIKTMSINEGRKYGYSAWKANVNGVDVNWNYDKDWSITRNRNNPRGSTGFNGLYPNSEPETVAMCNILDSTDFDAYISFHTQGQLMYFFDDLYSPTKLDRVLRSTTGFTVYYEKVEGIGGSFFDYAARKFGKTTITFELCPYVGNYPYPNTGFDTVWKPAQNILLTIGNYYQYIK